MRLPSARVSVLSVTRSPENGAPLTTRRGTPASAPRKRGPAAAKRLRAPGGGFCAQARPAAVKRKAKLLHIFIVISRDRASSIQEPDGARHAIRAQQDFGFHALRVAIVARRNTQRGDRGARQLHTHQIDIVILRRTRGIGQRNERGIFFLDGRSEERRVGKVCRSRWSPYH